MRSGITAAAAAASRITRAVIGECIARLQFVVMTTEISAWSLYGHAIDGLACPWECQYIDQRLYLLISKLN